MGKTKKSTIKTAIVTGGASGIGAAEIARLRSRGVNVIAADLNPDIETMYADDSGVVGIIANITKPKDAKMLVDRAESAFGHVDLLFHAAGIMPGGKIVDTPSEKTLNVMNINYGGTVHMIEAVLPNMHEQHSGQIVALGSMAGYVPSRGLASYSASKAAVNAYIETLAHEEEEYGVQVLLVTPNIVKTPLLTQATGGPKTLTDLATKEKSWLMITAEDVLNAVDKGLARKKTIVTPGGSAFYALRRFSPSLLWKITKALGA
jgi:short-subunit dehydrogenase